MMVPEARRIAQLVGALGVPRGTVCLNIGASTRHFREVEQPHLTTDLIGPLEAQGIRFVHCDLKPDEGVDVVGDVFDLQVRERMAAYDAGLLMCCNILEHLRDPQPFARACAGLVRPGGHLVVSVPLSFPYHRDPIDTMLRPTPEEIAAFFPGWTLAAGEVVAGPTFLQELRAQPRWRWLMAKHLLQVMVPFYRPVKWLERAHRMLWLTRPYKVSIAVLQRPESAG